MFDRYNQEARRALFFARFEAAEIGGRSIETEHLLLALIREPTRVTGPVFSRSRLPLELIRTQIADVTTFGVKVAVSVEIPFSDATKRVLQHPFDEANGLQHREIAPEHLLLGILREASCGAAAILIASGMDLDTARADVMQARTEHGGATSRSADQPPDRDSSR